MTDDGVTEGLVHMKVARSRLMRAAHCAMEHNLSSAHRDLMALVDSLDDSVDTYNRGVGFLRQIEDAYALGEDGI